MKISKQLKGSHKSKDFNVLTNRTHEKSENAAYDRESDPTSATP